MELHDFIGFAAAFLGLAIFFPQAVKTLKTKETKGISFTAYFALWLGVVLWLAYGIFLNKPPIILVNAVVASLVFIMLALKIKYK